MKREERENNKDKGKGRYALKSAKECAYTAVFVALLLAVQLLLSAIPVELVTVLFVSYAYVFGWKRAGVSAIAFSLLRQLIFGFFPTVLILYLLYFIGLALLFGNLRRRGLSPKTCLLFVTALACICTLCFTLLDNVLTPLWYGYTWSAAKAYFLSSLTFLIPHTIGVGLSVALLFTPLCRIFSLVGRGLFVKNAQK